MVSDVNDNLEAEYPHLRGGLVVSLKRAFLYQYYKEKRFECLFWLISITTEPMLKTVLVTN